MQLVGCGSDQILATMLLRHVKLQTGHVARAQVIDAVVGITSRGMTRCDLEGCFQLELEQGP